MLTFFILSWLVVFYACIVNFLSVVLESHGMARHVPDPSRDTPLYLVIMSPRPCLGCYCSSDSVFDDCRSLRRASQVLCIHPSVWVWLFFMVWFGEGNGTPLQYSCLESLMDGGAWWAAVHEVTKSRTQLSDFTLAFHFHTLEKEIATHSSILPWRIPGTGEPGGLPSTRVGSHTVGHDWSNLAAAAHAT